MGEGRRTPATFIRNSTLTRRAFASLMARRPLPEGEAGSRARIGLRALLIDKIFRAIVKSRVESSPSRYAFKIGSSFHYWFRSDNPGGDGFAQEARDLSAYEGRPRIQAIRIADDEAVTVDGKLEEPIWQRALPATDFVQQDPNLGQPATERTEVRIAFSRNNLYLGVICFDSEPDKLMGNTMLRDAALASGDRFQWTFDPYLDGRSGYFFEMNPSGSMGDSLLGGGGGGNFGNAARAWDGIWYAKVNKSDIGWTIEIEIPFRTLNFDPDAPAWGFNIQRTIRRKNEETLWTGWARNQGLRRMTNAGLIEGISDVSQGIGLNVQPYMTGSYKDYGCSSSGSCTKVDAGVDFIYSITPQLKGNFTINTDFAETEVDQRRVNLTRFPLFFPERRNFFLEGTTFFDFAREPGNAIIPFFSRRIGLVNGQPQRIDYGAKVTGQVGANDVGLIHVRTAGSDRLIGEDFTILRTKRRFFQQSYVGMLYTRRAERDTTNPDRYTAGCRLCHRHITLPWVPESRIQRLLPVEHSHWRRCQARCVWCSRRLSE